MKFMHRAAAVLLVVILLAGVLPIAFADGGEESLITAANQNVTYTEVDEIVYAVINVNIRIGPGTNFERLDLLPYGHSIQRVAIGSNGWSKVIYNGQVCYMFSDYLSTGKFNAALDTDKLSRQIAIANGLNQGEYTKESVAVMQEALAGATMALNGGTQATIDAMTQTLQNAIAGLVKMDYSQLQEALDAVESFTDGDPLMKELLKAVSKGMEQLSGTDQAEVDAAAVRINEALDAMQSSIDEMSRPQFITQEVEVEVPPNEDFCNVSGHQTWKVVMILSTAVNVLLLAMILGYISMKRKKHKDDTPLVDYDISDDNWA